MKCLYYNWCQEFLLYIGDSQNCILIDKPCTEKSFNPKIQLYQKLGELPEPSELNKCVHKAEFIYSPEKIAYCKTLNADDCYKAGECYYNTVYADGSKFFIAMGWHYKNDDPMLL